MICRLKTVEGTCIRFVVTLETPGGFTTDDIDFSIDFYVYPNKRKTFQKAETVRIDENCFSVALDTAGMGAGLIMYRIDITMPDGSREIISGDTNESLSKYI
jgi:hypothetical protein